MASSRSCCLGGYSNFPWSTQPTDTVSLRRCFAGKSRIRKYGAPKRIRSDNGPEFVAKAIGTWLKKADISSVYIQPGSPWENPYVESFHSRFRNDCLNREWFLNLLDAKSCIEIFREEYNTIRPHSSLSYRSPIEIYDSEGFA